MSKQQTETEFQSKTLKLTKTPINFSHHAVYSHNDAARVQKEFQDTRLVNSHPPNQHIISVFPISFSTSVVSPGIPAKTIKSETI